jgi:ABC-2 type transport system permease protein
VSRPGAVVEEEETAEPVELEDEQELEAEEDGLSAHELFWRSGILNVLAIARRELGAFCVSPVGWVVGTLIIVPVSLYGYLGPVLIQQQASMSQVFDLLANFLLPLLVPIYTMRLLAEERRTGTLEIMLTSPVRDWELVVGKWLGAFVFFLATIAFTLVYVGLLAYFFPERANVGFLGLPVHIATLDWGSILTGYVGLLLAGGSFVAIGLFASSLTQNQIVAAMVGFVLLLLIWYLGSVLGVFLQPPVGSFFQYVSGYNHYSNFAQGQIVLKDVVYFLTLIVCALFVTSRVLEARKWV